MKESGTNELLSTENVNVARFASNVKCDFFCDFQTLCYHASTENFPMVHQNGTARLKRKTNTKLMIGIGFDARDVEFLDLDNVSMGWKTLTR